jgi:hypothetical protein
MKAVLARLTDRVVTPIALVLALAILLFPFLDWIGWQGTSPWYWTDLVGPAIANGGIYLWPLAAAFFVAGFLLGRFSR